MRFIFCDRIVRIHKGESLEGKKVFPVSEEFLNGHFEALPIVPGAMLIETMSQFLGWLICYSHDFQCLPIISLIDDVEVTPNKAPGFEACVLARLSSTTGTDSLGQAEMRVNGEVIARANRMIYRHFSVHDPMPLRTQFSMLAKLSGTHG